MNQNSSERCPCCGAAFDRQWYANWLGTMPRGCTPFEIAFWECGSKRTEPDGITLSNKCLARQVKQRDSKLARIASACGLADPAEACRVILQIVKEKP